MRTGPVSNNVLPVGAGHAHMEVLRRFGLRTLPGVVAGHYGAGDVRIDTSRVARFAGARLVLDGATGIDLAASRVLRHDGPPVPFGVLSLDWLPPEHRRRPGRRGAFHPG